MTLTVIFSLVISVALFMMLPYFISRGIRPGDFLRDCNCDSGRTGEAWDFPALSGDDFPDEGYSENLYVSWSRAQVHKLH